MVVIDRADVLDADGRNALFSGLLAAGVPALVAMTFSAKRLMPDMAAIDALIDWAETEHAKGTASGWEQNDFATPRPESDCGTADCIAGKWGIDHGWTSQFRHKNLPVWRAPDGSMSVTPSVDAVWQAFEQLISAPFQRP